MSTFVSALGPGSGLRAFSQPPFGPLTSVGLKERFLKSTVLSAFASAKRIEHLHAFSVDSDCIRFGSGDRSVTLRPRLEYVPKSLSTPFERTETVSLSALATKSSPSQSADAQTAVCPVRALRFYIDRSSSVRQSIQLLGAMVGATKGRAVSKQSLSHWIVDAITEAYTTQGLENALCTLGAVQRVYWVWALSVVKMYVYSRYLLGSRLVFAEYLRQVLQAGRSVLSLPSAVGE